MTKRYTYALAGMLLGMTTLGAAQAQAPATTPAAPLMQTTFEDGVNGWTTLGTTAKLAVTKDAADIHGGTAALKYDYTVAKGQINALILPTPDGKLAGAKSFNFWVKADHASPLVFVLSEKGGGRYSALFTAPVGQWQQVTLAPSDFILGEGKDDPKDPDNKLDLDQVEAAGLVDFSQIFVQGEASMATMLGVQSGPRSLDLDDFTVNAASADPAVAPVDPSVIESFSTPQLSWAGLGGVTLSRDTKALGVPALQAAYKTGTGKLAAFLKPLRPGVLAGKTTLMFSLASVKPTTLLVHLEERGGGKYNYLLEAKGNSTVQPLSVAVSDFRPGDDSQDADGKLDMDQVNQFAVLDLTGMMGDPAAGGAADNTVWIGPISAK
ncbi:MAG: hypothetical protein M3Y28_08725 [Armatimonadota bacterium]|nr:hypothetical protein [Armatimonadota bacterium]